MIRYSLLRGVLILGVVLGFGSGVASVVHHVHHARHHCRLHGCGGLEHRCAGAPSPVAPSSPTP